jgi:hypothetical protein
MATASLRLTGNVIFNNATGNARMQMEQIGFPAAVIATGRIDAARLPLEPSITGNLTPTANILYSLGNATHRWKDLFLSGNTLYLGNAIISESSGGGGGISINAGAGSGSVALGPTRVLGNLVVEGNLTVLGGNVVEIQTETQITDQLIVTNAGTGPALIVEQTGSEDIAIFKDDGNVVVRIHDGSGAMSVGGDVANPLGTLHVVGNVYASGTYVGNGASLTSLNASAVTTGTQVRIGEGAGQTSQGSSAVAIGPSAGANVQSVNAVAVGDRAGSNTQGSLAVAVGSLAGRTSQGTRTVAIGHYAGEISQQPYAVAVGQGAGYSNQGSNAIAIGSVAAQANQAANSIVINATGVTLNNTTANSCVIKPVRDYASIARRVALYDATSGEVSTNSGHLTMDASNNVLVGTTSVNATGASLQVGGLGQNTVTAFNTAGNMGGSIVLKTTDGVVYSGGAVVFGVPQGNFAAIKGGLTNGGGNTLGDLIFATRNATSDSTLTTRMVIQADGNVGIGLTNPTYKLQVQGTCRIDNNPAVNTANFAVPYQLETRNTVEHLQGWGKGPAFVAAMYALNPLSSGWNGTSSILYLTRETTNSRSINAAGTVNASGADYAEYMTKCGNGDFTIAKGDVVGVDAKGYLTDMYDDAVTFVIKSTNPSLVGGDDWGIEDADHPKPPDPSTMTPPSGENASEEEIAAYAEAVAAHDAWTSEFEAKRARVDRIAFSGQVPVNVFGASSGDYIVPVRADDDGPGIAAIAVPDNAITFEQYRRAVGRVVKIMDDGRAFAIVKVA